MLRALQHNFHHWRHGPYQLQRIIPGVTIGFGNFRKIGLRHFTYSTPTYKVGVTANLRSRQKPECLPSSLPVTSFVSSEHAQPIFLDSQSTLPRISPLGNPHTENPTQSWPLLGGVFGLALAAAAANSDSRGVANCGPAHLMAELGPGVRRGNIYTECQGKRVGIDTLCWLHEFALRYCHDVYEGEYESVAKAVVARATMMRAHGVYPILVFDGEKMPGKGETNAKRSVRKYKYQAAVDKQLAEHYRKKYNTQLHEEVDEENFHELVCEKCLKRRIFHIIAALEQVVPSATDARKEQWRDAYTEANQMFLAMPIYNLKKKEEQYEMLESADLSLNEYAQRVGEEVLGTCRTGTIAVPCNVPLVGGEDPPTMARATAHALGWIGREEEMRSCDDLGEVNHSGYRSNVPQQLSDSEISGVSLSLRDPWAVACVLGIIDEKLQFNNVLDQRDGAGRAIGKKTLDTEMKKLNAVVPTVDMLRKFLLARNYDSLSGTESAWHKLAKKVLLQLNLEAQGHAWARRQTPPRPLYLPRVRDPSGKSMIDWLVRVGLASTDTYTQLAEYDIGPPGSVQDDVKILQQRMPELPLALVQEYNAWAGAADNDYIRMNRRGVHHEVDARRLQLHEGRTDGANKNIMRVSMQVPASYKQHDYYTVGYFKVDRSKGDGGQVTAILKMTCSPTVRKDETVVCKAGAGGHCTHCNALLLRMMHQQRAETFESGLAADERAAMVLVTDQLSKWMQPSGGKKYAVDRSAAFIPVVVLDHQRIKDKRLQVGTDDTGGRLYFDPVVETSRHVRDDRYTEERTKHRHALYDQLFRDATDQRGNVVGAQKKEERRASKRFKLPRIDGAGE